THDFSILYVAENNARETPTFYSIISLWAALEGSILLWTAILAGATAFIPFRATTAIPRLATPARAVMFAMLTFFLLLITPPAADPFARLAVAPENGNGPNALLQNHLLMPLHPPLLYLVYVLTSVPFAYALSSLILGEGGDRWLVATRRFALVSWALLGVGIVAGAWWSYAVLGWGGYWAWDPVENAAIMPWLTATAYLHSVMVEEKRRLLRTWNLALVIATFALTILGTFLTRSGVVNSVHSFTQSAIGPLLLGYLVTILVLSVGLLLWRSDRLRDAGATAAVLAYALAAFVAATVVREFARGIRGRRALHAEGGLIAFANLFRRSGRRYGGYVVHLGIVLVALAIATSQARTVDAEKTLAPGETLAIAGYTVRLSALRSVHEPQRDSVVADLEITGNGSGSQLDPALVQYPSSASAVGSPGVGAGIRDDLYTILAAYDQKAL